MRHLLSFHGLWIALLISILIVVFDGAVDDQDYHEASNDQDSGDEGEDDDTSSAGGELSANHVVLALEVSMEAKNKCNDTNGDEGCAERLAESLQPNLSRRRIRLIEGGVQSEELSDGYANTCEGK